MASIRGDLLDAYEHQNYPFGKLIKKLNIPRNPSRPTLVTVTFNLDKARSQPPTSGPELAAPGKPGRSAKFDISLDITESDKGLKIEWEFNTDLFDAETIRRWSRYFQTMLNAIAAGAGRRLSELEILDEGERQQLLVEWNDTAADYERVPSVHALIERQVAATPDRVALVCGDQQMSYAELNRRANQLGHYLRVQGAGPETAVGLCMERSAEMMVGLLGILKAGAAYLPLDPAYPRQRLQLILDDARVKLLLTEAALADQLGPLAARVILMEEASEQARRYAEADPQGMGSEANLAYLIYTSGSTGRPKGVAIQHHNAVTFAQWAAAAFPPETTEGVLASTSICFDLSVFELFATLSRGGKVILADNALRLAELTGREAVTLINTVPSAMAELVRQGAVPRSVRVVNLAGEALSRRLADEVYGLGHIEAVNNLYGPSEDTTYSTWGRVRQGAGEVVTIGRPVANTRVYVLSESLETVPVGVAGELYIGGAGLARGYFNRAELTAERFVPDPFGNQAGERLYRTGDVCRWRRDGEVEYLGRADQQVKVRGYRIELGEIEAALRSQPGVAEAVVVAREDEAGTGKRLVAYLVCEDDAQRPAAAELRNRLKQELPGHMIPAAFVVLEKLPLNANGKVDRKALPPPEASRAELDKSYAEPLTSVEKVLTGIWAETLGLDKIGIHDNFFDLGGDSILSMRIITKANQAGLRLAPQQIFQHQTIAELARAAGTGSGLQAEQSEVTGPIQLIPINHWFFEQELTEPHHFNLSNLFDMPRLDGALLEKAVAQLLIHHDALRLRCVSTEAGNQLVVAGVGEDTPFSREDLS
ncbi:MAG TPA: amino acid adenylation domain-containing protein, partial [Blastocatellia bacterium]|nr:amino acid adenylation domain-containing protein [Blastocatellia bacterium]